MPPIAKDGSIQLRTLANRAGIPVRDVRNILRRAGVRPLDAAKRGNYLRETARVDLVAAAKALNLPTDRSFTEATRNEGADPLAAAAAGVEPKPPATSAPDLSGLAAASAAAEASLPRELDAVMPSTGTGNSDDPIPAALRHGDITPNYGRAPKVTHPDPDMVYWWVNINPNRQFAMRERGWRFITDTAIIRRIRPDGLFLGMRSGSDARVRYIDTELVCLPREMADRYRAAREIAPQVRAEASEEGFREQVEESKARVRQRFGPDAARQIGYVEVDEGEAEDRASRTAARRAGLDTGKVQVDLGSTSRR